MSTDPRSRAVRWAGRIVVAGGLAALPVLALRRVSDPSPWLHLKVGRFLLDGHRFTLPDPWAPFAGHEYVPTQWLPSVLSAGLHERFGTAVIAWERSAGIALLALALLLWSSSLARTWIAVSTTGLVMFCAWPSLTERPQLAGFLLLIPVLAAWWRTGLDHRPRWWLVPVTWLAASTHGIWATAAGIGAIVTLSLVVSRSLTKAEALRLFGLLAACAGAAAVTPLGPRLLLSPFAVSSQGRQFIQEWMPSSVRAPHVLATLLMLGLVWLCWTVRREGPPAWQLILWLSAFVLTLSMERTVPVAAMVLLPLLGTAVESVMSAQASAGQRAREWPAWVAAALVGIAVAAPLATARATVPAGLPTGLQPALEALPADSRILLDSDTSGWVLFAAPHLRPVYDLRVEAYTPQRVEDYITVMDAEPGWDRLLAASGASSALVPKDSPIRAALTEQSRWTEVDHDAGLVLLEAPR